MSQTEKTLGWVLKGGLLLTPFIVLIVTRALYFPFITGKNFTFRILVEVLAALWVFAALRFPSFRPRTSALAWAVLIFMAVLGAATVFSISPYHSFWSNYERMEGYIGLLHLFLYFLILGSVFRGERDWKLFFNTSLAVSVVVALYSVLQLLGKLTIHQGGTRVDATLGNATYLGVYLLMHLLLTVVLFFWTNSRALKAAYAAIFVLHTVILYYTASRGPILGFLIGLFIFAGLSAVLTGGRARRLAAGVLVVLVLVPAAFFLVKDTPFVHRDRVLARFIDITQDAAIKGRLVIWQMALRGWQERPILGWGQESFVYVFSKYYEPSLWRNEPWFDRAHNVFLDWLTSGGIVGLGAYLAMFGTAFWLLLGAFRRGSIDRFTFSGFSAILSAHFFQNMFVFDNLTSYILFFAFLAYIHSTSPRPLATGATAGSAPVAVSGGVQAAVAVLVGMGTLLTLYVANIKPIHAARDILGALEESQRPEPAGKVDALMNTFKEGIALNTFGTTELREQVSQVASFVVSDQAIALQDKTKYLEFAVSELEAQRRAFPYDIRAKAFLATLYATAGRPADAIAAVSDALQVSDRRPQFYFIAAEAYLNVGRYDQALAALQRAYDLAPDYPEATVNLVTVLILSGREQEAESFLEQHFGHRFVAEPRYAQAYVRVNDFTKAATVWELVVKANPNDARSHAELGAVYAAAGRTAEAITEVRRAIELDPAFKAQGEELIRQLQSRQ